jgi:hypothetical protein
MTQTAISNSGDPNCADITAGFLNMPDPIIEPITIVMDVVNPMRRTNS